MVLYSFKGSDREISPEEKALCISWLIENHEILSPSEILYWAQIDECLTELLEKGGEQMAYIRDYATMLDEIEELMKLDDKKRFTDFLNTNVERVNKFPPSALFYLLCSNCAIACTYSLLESQFNVDVNVEFDGGWYPLHFAAKHLSVELTGVLLQHGAKTDVELLSKGSPLRLALDMLLRTHDSLLKWEVGRKGSTTKQSIISLLHLLSSPELRSAFDTILLLVAHTHTDQLEGLCMSLIENGKVVELVALLSVACDRLLLSSNGGLESTPVSLVLENVLREKVEKIREEIYAGTDRCVLSYKNKILNARCVVKTFWERYCGSLPIENATMDCSALLTLPSAPSSAICPSVTQEALNVNNSNPMENQPRITSKRKRIRVEDEPLKKKTLR